MFRACHVLSRNPFLLGNNISRARMRTLVTEAAGGRTHAVLIIYDNGTMSRERMTVADIRRRTGIHARDLILLNLDNDPGALPTQAHVVVGEGTVLLSIGYMKVVVERHACLVFRPNFPVVKTGATTLASAIATRATSELSSRIPFELVCIEAVLREVVDAYYRRVQIMRPIVESFLKSLSESSTEAIAVRQLLPLKEGLADLDDKTTQITDALIALLKSDEDMVGLMITRRHELAMSGKAIPLSEHEGMELLLETYHRKYSVVRQHIRQLQRNVQNAQDLATFHLDLYRNRLLALDIKLAIVAVSLAVPMAVAGFLGMNVPNGLEANPDIFWPLVGGVTIASGGGCAYFMNHLMNFRKTSISSSTGTDLEALRWVTQNLHVVEHGLRGAWMSKSAHRGNGVTRKDLADFLSASAQKPVTGSQVDLLMSILDQSKDSILQQYEYEKLVESMDGLADLMTSAEHPKNS